jgi:hypothetical protein
MTELAYIAVDRGKSPRLVEVANVGNGGSDSLKIQDLHDTLNSDTLPAGDADDSLDNMDDDFIIESAGKATLGPSLSTGITATLQNAQLAFEGNYTPAETGSATSADATGQLLTDTSAQFITNGVCRGGVVLNWHDHSAGEVLEVLSETQLLHRPLQAGANNDWEIGDDYSVFCVIQKTVSDGNLNAVDSNGDLLNAIYPTFCTQVVVTLDTSAAQVATAGLTPSQQQIRDAMTLARTQAVQPDSIDELLDSNPANVVAALLNTDYDGKTYEDVILDLLAMANGKIVESPEGTYTVFNQDDTPRYRFQKLDNERTPVAIP